MGIKKIIIFTKSVIQRNALSHLNILDTKIENLIIKS